MTTHANTPADAASAIKNGKATTKKATPSLLAFIREDYIAHGRDWTKPGFRALAAYRFGVWRMRIRPKLLRAPFSILYRALFRHARNHYGIELPYSASLGRRVIIEHQSGIVIHGHAVIGDDCIIRQGVTLGNRYLEKPFDAPTLGNSVNLGAGAKILGPVHIGDHASIGANAVVLTDVPAHALAVGIPARIIIQPYKAGDGIAGPPAPHKAGDGIAGPPAPHKADDGIAGHSPGAPE